MSEGAGEKKCICNAGFVNFGENTTCQNEVGELKYVKSDSGAIPLDDKSCDWLPENEDCGPGRKFPLQCVETLQSGATRNRELEVCESKAELVAERKSWLAADYNGTFSACGPKKKGNPATCSCPNSIVDVESVANHEVGI